MVYKAKKGRAKVSTTYRLVFLAAGGRSLLSVLAHLILGRQTLSSGMISSGYFVEKGIVARTEENGEEADTSPGNTDVKLIPSLTGSLRLSKKDTEGHKRQKTQNSEMPSKRRQTAQVAFAH